ncbi:MAG: peptidase U37 [Magnetococcales bacterium]|nr:peptidase U37 [Magnetococcales bacterium]
MPTMVEMPLQNRSANFVPATVDSEARTIEMVWSTGAAVRRRDWNTGQDYDEILSMDPAHVRLDRLNGGAPLLNSHDLYDLSSVLGVVEKAWIAKGEGRAVVRFSNREDVIPIWSDVKEGIIRNVSISFRVYAFQITDAAGKIQERLAVDWEPYELSAVTVGADPGAGFRSAEKITNPCQMIQTRGAEMPDNTPPKDEATADDVTTRQVTPPPVEVATKPADPAPLARGTTPEEVETMTRNAITAERKRSAEIYEAQGKLQLDRSFADKLVQDGVTLDDARRSLIDEAARRSSASAHISNHIATPGGQDERTTRREAVESALMHRFNPANQLTDAAREWRGLSLIEIARDFMEADSPRSTRGESRQSLATRSLMTNSDFPNILANVANKTLRNAYDAAPRTFMPFCRHVTASDFKNMTRVQLGEAPALEKVNESGEFKRGSMGEGKEQYRVETYGKIMAITRQTIVNDDLNAFTRIPELFGLAAANLESDVVWSIITANAAMGDGVVLFHATHKNLAAAGAVISVASLGLGRKTMALQTGIDGVSIINARPAFIIVPAALEVTAEQLLANNMTPAKSSDVVPQAMRLLTVIAEPRLDASSATAWYLSANPGAIDTIEYAHLDGQNGVYIETRIGYEVDGVEIKARLDFGAKAIDWRGMYKNPGV